MVKSISDSYDRVFGDKKRILVVFAHPDDLELYCGGTVARLVSDSKIVRSIKVTNGDMGSRQENITSEELGRLRMSEDRNSMKKLGISENNNIYLGFKDGSVGNKPDVIGKIAEQIRLFKPDLIITHNPQDFVIRFEKDVNWFNHRDHRNTGQAAIDASYPFARDILFYPEHFKNPDAKSWTCPEFLFVDSYGHGDSVFVDVTDYIAQRVAAHAMHASQYTLQNAQESADFFTKGWDPKGKRNFETFRYVIAD